MTKNDIILKVTERAKNNNYLISYNRNSKFIAYYTTE